MPEKTSSYDTRQRRMIQSIIERLDAPFTARDLCAKLEDARPRVSRATIYRVLQSLCLEGKVRQTFLPDGRRVCTTSVKGTAWCIIECADCGKLSSCDAKDFDACFEGEASKRHLQPIQAAAYMMARCDLPRCKQRRESAVSSNRSGHPRMAAQRDSVTLQLPEMGDDIGNSPRATS